MPSYGASYEAYNKLFNIEALDITPSVIYQRLGLVTALLFIIAFFSLSVALLVNKKNKSHVGFVTNAAIASVSIGFGSVLLSNYVGVYI